MLHLIIFTRTKKGVKMRDNMSDTKLYNLIFPTFILLYFSPKALAISLLGNLIIDSVLIIIISCLIYGKFNKTFFFHSVFVAWGFGFLADIIGAIISLIGYLNSTGQTKHTFFVYIGIIIAAIFIYLFNYFCTFARFELDKTQRILSSLTFAIITAPYTFLLPEEILMGLK